MNTSNLLGDLHRFLSFLENRIVDTEVIGQLKTEELITMEFELRFLSENKFESFYEIRPDGPLSFIVIERSRLSYRAEFDPQLKGALKSFKFLCHVALQRILPAVFVGDLDGEYFR